MLMCKEQVEMRLEEEFGWSIVNMKIMDRFLQLDKGVSRVGFKVYVELTDHLYEVTMWFNNNFTITVDRKYEEVEGLYDFKRYFAQE